VRLVVVQDAAVAPVNNGAPTLPGSAIPGDGVTCTPGTWTPTPDAFAFSWTLDGAVIGGQTGGSYVVAAGDVGHSIRCVVVASSQGAQSAPATSNALVPTAPAATPTPTPTVTATPTPTPTPVPATPVTVPIQQIATLPSARKCVSRRVFRIHLRAPKGEKLVSANVFVNGKRFKAVKGKRLTAPVDLRGLPKGRWTVKIVLTTASGKRFQAKRKYRTCVPKRKS
jgi:hypothetical protein